MPMHLSRRKFIRATSLAATAVAAGATGLRADDDPPTPPPKYNALIGTHLDGWAAYYARMNKTLADNLDEALSAIRDCGYDYVEGRLDLEKPENNTTFAQRLKGKGFTPVCIDMTGTFHETATAVHNVNRYLESAKTAYEAGFTLLNCRAQSLDRDKKPAELNTQITALRQFGEGLGKFGMRLGVHHNLSDTRRGGWDYQAMFRQSPGKTIGFCFDVGTLHRGGIAPMDALKDYTARLVSWQLRQSREGVWLEDLTKGDIDYETLIPHAKRYRLAPYYTVALELDKDTKITRSVVENHKRSRDYLKALLGT